MFGAALEAARRIAAGNRWLVVAFAILAGLWGTELLVERFANLWPKLATMSGQIQATNAVNAAKYGVIGPRDNLSDTGRPSLTEAPAPASQNAPSPIAAASTDGRTGESADFRRGVFWGTGVTLGLAMAVVLWASRRRMAALAVLWAIVMIVAGVNGWWAGRVHAAEREALLDTALIAVGGLVITGVGAWIARRRRATLS